MACMFETDGHICEMGFPQTAGCVARKDSGLEKNYIATVKCKDEEWCGRVYNWNGGKPKLPEDE